jgi:membrane protease YdiL (CAAX protease family)
MSSTGAAPTTTSGPTRPEGGFARRRPLTAFLLIVFGVGYTSLLVPLLVGIPMTPFLLVLTFVGLLGGALVVTRLADGPGAPRKLLSRLLLWRFGLGRWALILFGVPLLTLALAAVSGTLTGPSDGWAVEIGWYLFNTLILGALTLNLWEELGWAGFAQSRLMARHGLLVGSLITAVFFAAIHIPLYLEGEPTGSEVVIGLAVLFAVAPVYRYLVGMMLLDTGGSILAVGVLHASWNAAPKLDAVDGGPWDWQVLVAVTLLTVLIAAGRRLRNRSQPAGPESEKAAARSWIAPPARGTASTSGQAG